MTVKAKCIFQNRRFWVLLMLFINNLQRSWCLDIEPIYNDKAYRFNV